MVLPALQPQALVPGLLVQRVQKEYCCQVFRVVSAQVVPALAAEHPEHQDAQALTVHWEHPGKEVPWVLLDVLVALVLRPAQKVVRVLVRWVSQELRAALPEGLLVAERPA